MRPRDFVIAMCISAVAVWLMATYTGYKRFAPDDTVAAGDAVSIGRPDEPPVWMALGADNYDALLDAQNAIARGGQGAGALRLRLADANLIFVVEAGCPGLVRSTGLGWADVELTKGKYKGRVGRIQRELLSKQRSLEDALDR